MLYYLNSNIEIHKCKEITIEKTVETDLNSNIEIHKLLVKNNKGGVGKSI